MAKNHKNLKDVILGGQDGLVNVLGLILGVASATASSRLVIIAGIAGNIAESISMAAVAYTSLKASKSYYLAERKKEPEENKYPLKSAMVVGFSAVVGSTIPIIPFFFLDVTRSMAASVIVSIIALFGLGSARAFYSSGDWKSSGAEVAIIGILSALVGYFVGRILGVVV